ncbi:MAG: RIP metalloprotease RseP [Cycloclasticus sp.]|nr:RIP metalloprotease RseP [Cycloclasticus sp.]MBQ0789032.1 RIP metalloprotease RseP [Cycloclasticus sp.]
MTLLISIAAFIVALGILVTVHEFGHFWVARRCGVKVLRFSVGFGKPLFSFNRPNDPTDYVIAGIPLGGYVKMLDEADGDVADSEKHLAFNNKPLWNRFLIVLAGPAFNLIFALIAFWLILIIGEKGLKPVIGELSKTGVAIHSGLEVGDEIIAINDRHAAIWRVTAGLMASELLDSGSVTLSVKKSDGRQKKVQLALPLDDQLEPNDILKQIGISPLLPLLAPRIGDVMNGEPGDVAGLLHGDLILSVNQQAIDTWGEWVQLTRSSPNLAMRVELLRDDELLSLTVTPKAVMDDELSIGRIGVSPLIDPSINQRFYATYSLGVLPGLIEAAIQTTSYSVLTVKMIGRMLMGEASIQNLSGPISLAQYAGQTASIGLVSFLKFLAFVSVSLGVINLLPIPMLDGGHLFFYLIEAIKGRPVSDKAQAVFMRMGMLMLISMMLLAVFVDLGRLVG